ncbi:MAG: O-acetyl-ADP-ribose deacetylase [Spirochaetaceae bacterium]|jgi:O-acetyl-ADP-ribose deacetylase (regulator of RNase III)|nr:O-acetyl-ADP-ribose deacetylase [Spirochaetaceae bacterium]
MASIELVSGDITTQKVDAIVNAANSGLLGGGGVDGAIHRAAGRDLYEECLRLPEGPYGRCPTGECVVTGAGRLPCKKVIHTVGPVYGSRENDAALLGNCYRNSLLAAGALGFESIAFPNISTGVYNYPKDEAARVAISAVRETLPQTPSIKRVLFVCFGSENYSIYEKLMGGNALDI